MLELVFNPTNKINNLLAGDIFSSKKANAVENNFMSGFRSTRKRCSYNTIVNCEFGVIFLRPYNELKVYLYT